MRGGVTLNLVRLLSLLGMVSLMGCGNPVADLCTARADYFDSCAGVATEGGWNLVKNYDFYGVGGREEFVSSCEEQGRTRLDSLAEDEQGRLEQTFSSQALQYKKYVEDGVCGPVP